MSHSDSGYRSIKESPRVFGEDFTLKKVLQSPMIDDAYLGERFGISRKDEEAFIELYTQLPVDERPSLSPYFDAKFYRATNTDLGHADPLLHFITQGITKFANPHPLLDLKLIAFSDPAGFR
jgi:hypothetical protein